VFLSQPLLYLLLGRHWKARKAPCVCVSCKGRQCVEKTWGRAQLGAWQGQAGRRRAGLPGAWRAAARWGWGRRRSGVALRARFGGAPAAGGEAVVGLLLACANVTVRGAGLLARRRACRRRAAGAAARRARVSAGTAPPSWGAGVGGVAPTGWRDGEKGRARQQAGAARARPAPLAPPSTGTGAPAGVRQGGASQRARPWQRRRRVTAAPRGGRPPAAGAWPRAPRSRRRCPRRRRRWPRGRARRRRAPP
jgi:hypothetical protein